MNEHAAQAPVITQSVTVFRSIGGIVDAAASTAAVLVSDLDGHLATCPPELRRELTRLCDAVYDLDYRLDS